MKKFAVSDVEVGKPYETLDAQTGIRNLLSKPMEAMHCATARLVSCDTQHAFVKAAHDAFYDHHPLLIRPDDIWFCIAQGFAIHVGQNAEALRSRFVSHQGKQTLVVERADFVLGQPNPWPEVFDAFSVQIGDQVGEMKDIVSARFSTTTLAEAAAFDVCLMDSFKGYFDYELRFGCGIPEIRLLGTPQDWASMIPRLKRLAAYGLETWGETLCAVIEKMERAAAGEVDADFWRSFFRDESGSGPAELTGWIVTLFPYLIVNWQTGELGPNEYLGSWKARFDAANARTSGLRMDVAAQGPGIGAVPQALASAPVRCVDMRTGLEQELRLVAGMFGVAQDSATGALSPAFGWAVVYDMPLLNAVPVRVVDEVTGTPVEPQ
ncbi:MULTISPECIES: DUF4419 domain-containing protein [unclassified Variovorax]|uniref:DUF4419 domain-containing protein n=1 Tax=unclassified Variovorax TaxID=663243 RepID=UPI003F483A92